MAPWPLIFFGPFKERPSFALVLFLVTFIKGGLELNDLVLWTTRLCVIHSGTDRGASFEVLGIVPSEYDRD